MIKGHIHRILWDKIDEKNKNYFNVGLVIKNVEDNIIKITGKMKKDPRPCREDYINAKKTGEMYGTDVYVCSEINIEFPIKKDIILEKIIDFSDGKKGLSKLTKKEATFLIENNEYIWDLIKEKKYI